MALHTMSSNDRGVSEAIGFMLIFSIVIAGIGLVTLYGYPLLLQQQVSADEKIMEKNMIVLQNDFKSLAYKTVPFKETSLKIGGGSLMVYNSSYVPPLPSSGPPSSKIEIYDFAGNEYIPPFTPTATFIPGELRYESISAQTDLSLQNGAVVMRPRVTSGSVMLAEPRWFYDSTTNTMVINLINITSTELMAKEGIGTVQMMLVGEPYYNETVFISNDPRFPITINYTPDSMLDYSIAWDNYFNKTLGMWKTSGTPGSGTGTPITYLLPIDKNSEAKLVIKIFEVKIKSI